MIDCILRGILEHAICLACCQEDALYEANNVFSLCHQQQHQAKDEHFCFNTESSCAGPEVSTQAPVRKNHDIKNTEEKILIKSACHELWTGCQVKNLTNNAQDLRLFSLKSWQNQRSMWSSGTAYCKQNRSGSSFAERLPSL